MSSLYVRSFFFCFCQLTPNVITRPTYMWQTMSHLIFIEYRYGRNVHCVSLSRQCILLSATINQNSINLMHIIIIHNYPTKKRIREKENGRTLSLSSNFKLAFNELIFVMSKKWWFCLDYRFGIHWFKLQNLFVSC